MSDGNNRNSVVTKAHLPTTYSRTKRSGTQASAINRKVPSAQRAKSCRIYQNRTEDVVMNNDGLHSIYWEGAQRRNKRARTSPISSDGLDSNASLVSLIPRVLMKSSVSNLVSKLWNMSMPWNVPK